MKKKSKPGTIKMKNKSFLQIILTISVLQGMSLMSVYAQSYPPSGFALPEGKSICITYEVEVNSNACPTGSIAPDYISNQSNVSGSNFMTVNTHDLTPAMPDPTLTPFAGILLGNLVYLDENSNGMFDGTDTGINGVLLNVYHDVNDDGMLDAGDTKLGSTNTSNIGGMDGMYYFNLCPGKYIIEVDADNFIMGGALYNPVHMVPLLASGTAENPDDHMDNINHGAPVSGFGVASASITIDYLEGPGDVDEYPTLDFGFRNVTSLTIDDPVVMEGNTGDMNSLVYTITRTDNEAAFDIDIGITGGTAIAGVDYIVPSTTTVSFVAGGSLTATFEVEIIGDDLVELDETVLVTLSNPPAEVIIGKAIGTGTIQNDDSAEISVGNVSDPESNGPFEFDVTITNPVDVDVTVLFSTSDGTATTLDNDYTAVSMQLVTFPAGSTMAQTVNVPVINDNKVELDETFTVTISDLVAMGRLVTIMNAMGTGTIQKDEMAEISVGNVSDLEANGPFVFEVTITNPVDVDVTVLFSTSDGTATTLDNDYTAVTLQLVTFPAGSTIVQTVNVPVIYDNKVELDETFMVTISDLMAMGRSVTIMSAMGTGTIQNDDMAFVTIDSVSMDEGNTGDMTEFIFTVTLEGEVDAVVSLNYTTMDSTATVAGMDYEMSSGMLMFSANGGSMQMQTITIIVIGDEDSEGDEYFKVMVSDLDAMGRDVQIATTIGLGTILDDDCMLPDIPELTQDTVICPLDKAVIRVLSGALNQAEEWVLYTDFCGGTEVARNDSGIFHVMPGEITEYFIRGEGGCVMLEAACASVTVIPASQADPSFDLSICCPYETAVYVRAGATGNNDGTDWENAFLSLADALTAISDCQGLSDEIWVAEGIYYPDDVLGVQTGDRNASFEIRDGIRLYGGFPASGNPGSEDRDPSNLLSILCGDIGVLEEDADNAYHVMKGIQLSDQTIIDGFVIRKGMADGIGDDAHGAGIFLSSQGDGGVNIPRFHQVTLENNMATGHGEGIYSRGNSTGSPEIENASFIGNTALQNGGGMYSAAISDFSEASPRLINVQFVDNTAHHAGGGFISEAIGTSSQTQILMVNVLFAKNRAEKGGAIAMINSGEDAVSQMKVLNNTISDNVAGDMGGGIYHVIMEEGSSSFIEIVNSIIYRNEATSGKTMHQEGSHASVDLSYNLVDAEDCSDGLAFSILGGSIVCDEESFLFNNFPGFIDAAGNNYSIHAGAVVINRGTNDDPDIHDPDLAGNQRILGPKIDLGAYESTSPVRVIPALSEWGFVILTLLVMIIGKVVVSNTSEPLKNMK